MAEYLSCAMGLLGGLGPFPYGHHTFLDAESCWLIGKTGTDEAESANAHVAFSHGG